MCYFHAIAYYSAIKGNSVLNTNACYSVNETQKDPVKDQHFFFSVKIQIVNILGFVGHIVFVATTQLCYCNVKAVIDNMEWVWLCSNKFHL